MAHGAKHSILSLLTSTSDSPSPSLLKLSCSRLQAQGPTARRKHRRWTSTADPHPTPSARARATVPRTPCPRPTPTLCPPSWAPTRPTSQPAPATLCRAAWKRARRRRTLPWRQAPGSTTARPQVSTWTASHRSPCRAAHPSPELPPARPARARTARRGWWRTCHGHPPSLWASGTLNLSLHWWLMC